MNISASTPPLDEVMLAMDVVDTLRHRQGLVAREMDEASREKLLVEKLRDIYHQQGIDVPDHILKEGVTALVESRFAYTPHKGGARVALARLYVARGNWARWIGVLLLLALMSVLGHQFAYVPFQQSQIETARIELAETLPAEMNVLYNSIYEETKVQSAVERADLFKTRGEIAAGESDRAGATTAIASLTTLRDTIRRDYTLRIVNREGAQSAFWTFPEVNRDATNYYLVVEAIDGEGQAMSLPIANEETGEVETVSLWGVRVAQSVYSSVETDKRDDGIIQRNIIGRKQYGYVDVDYVVPVLGGAVTRW